MSDHLSSWQCLLLWRLAVTGGGDWNSKIKPALKRPDRQRLTNAGFIEAEQRKPVEGGRPQFYIELTEKGWAWLAEHFDAELSRGSRLPVETLQRFLARLKDFLKAKRLSLAEFIHPSPDGDFDSSTDLEPLIQSAYFQLTGGQPNVRVRLADLRSFLADVPRQELDRALLTMVTGGKASLYRLDNPLEIQDRDREAVLRAPSGEERHILYLGGPGS